MDYQALAELLFPHVTEPPEEVEARFPQRTNPEGAVITRMAPSPTGFVHLGNLVQGMISERMAHQSGGVLFLRVEDTDAKREVPGAVEVLINSLKHYNINFDEGATIDGDSGNYGPYRQRQRAAIYHVFAKKLNPAGSLFDYAKLVDVSKNVISRMDADTVYTLLTEWANEFDPDFGAKLSADPELATKVLAIGRGGKKPRKDLATWKDAKDYMGFFYDEYLTEPVFDEKFDKAVIVDVLNRFLEKFDISDDSNTWFDKVKEITTEMGFTTDMKAYKADPTAFPGTVADVSTFIRQAVTGKTNSPDLYTVMQILGYERTVERIKATIAKLN